MFEDVEWRTEPWYFVLAIAITVAVLQFTSMLIGIGYLKSKPLGHQTVVDKAHLTVFTSMLIFTITSCIQNFCLAMFSNSGENLSTIVGWVCSATVGLMLNSFCVSTLVQSLLVVKPNLIGNIRFEKWTKATVYFVLPTANFIISGTLHVMGIRQFHYYQLKDSVMMFSATTPYSPAAWFIFATRLSMILASLGARALIEWKYTIIRSNQLINSKLFLLGLFEFTAYLVIVTMYSANHPYLYLVPMFICLQFQISTILAHENLYDYACKRPIIRQFIKLAQFRHARRIHLIDSSTNQDVSIRNASQNGFQLN